MQHPLTDEQAAILQWVQDETGHLVIRARAGTGKTYVLERVVETIPQDVDPRDLVVCAYNKGIQRELDERIERPCTVKTVHALGFAAWRAACKGMNIQVDGDKVYKLVQARAGVNIEPQQGYFPQDPRQEWLDLKGPICRLVSLAKQTGVGFLWSIEDRRHWYDIVEHHGLNDLGEHSVDELVEKSTDVLKESLSLDTRVIDFDDMVLAPLIHKAKIWFKKWVLVDEAQDLSPCRRALCLALAGKSGRMIFVGDDRQAIYGFSGADHRSIDEIIERTGAQVLPLTVNWRCDRLIIEAAQNLVPDIQAAPDKPDGLVVIPGVNDEIHPMPDDMGKGDAIISRTNARIIKEAYAYLAAGTACRVEGREIGTGLIKLATRWKTVKTLGALIDRLDDYEHKEVQKWMARNKEKRAEAVQDQCECIRVIARKVMSDGGESVYDFKAEIERMFGDNVTDCLVLLTGHKAKGREWDRVVILDYNEMLNCPWDRQEWQKIQSQNLAYVSLTRARHELYIA